MICGSVVSQNEKSPKFQRKLLMLKADIFSALCVSQSTIFLKDGNESKTWKIAIKKYLESPQVENFQFLDGWNKILYDKCN
jgi:hypothetical protein